MATRTRISVLAVFLFLLPAVASAATISLQATPANVGMGDTVRVDLLLTSAIATNAFSGALSYAKTLVPVAVSDGNSIISLWITHPAVPAPGALITFAGITPGGFSGDRGVLFSVLFRATAAGTANVSLENVEVLRNDGVGGNEPVTLKSLVLSVSSKSSGGYTEPADHAPPEPFIAILDSNPQIFGGRFYLAFTAVDKGSGIDHYTVAESRVPSFLLPFLPLSFETTTSPYVLTDQNLTSTVYIKAVDRAGNERLVVFPPRHLLNGFEETALLGILVAVVLLWQIVWRSGWGRRFRKNI